MSYLLELMVWLTVVIGPIAFLLVTELKFLPYHLEWLTWWHRILLACDLLLLWFFWPHIMLSRSRTEITAGSAVGFALCLITFAVVAQVFTFPGERAARVGPAALKVIPASAGTKQTVAEWLFGDRGTWSREGASALMSNFLVLPDEDFVDDEVLDKVIRSVRLRKRDLRGAILARTDLRKADLKEADLRGTLLEGADLRKVDLTDTDLRGADLSNSRLDEADFTDSRLQETKLRGAQLKGATLTRAYFILADLVNASLAGAKALDREELTHFEEADLTGADLRATSIFLAQFQGATFKDADFRGASLHASNFSGADLNGAVFDGATLEAAVFWRARPVGVTACFAEFRWPYFSPVVVRANKRPPLSLVDPVLDSMKRSLSMGLTEAGTKRLREKLDALRQTGPFSVQKEENETNEALWKDALGESCDGGLPQTLINMACSATASVYVPRGLIYNSVLDDLEPQNLSLVTQAFQKLETCPSAAGLSDRDRAELLKHALPH